MKKAVFLFTLLVFSLPAYAKEVMVIMLNSEILKGDMVGANETVLFLNENGAAREINLSDIKEVFDSQTNQRILVKPAPVRSQKQSLPPAYPGGPGPAGFGKAGQVQDSIPQPANYLEIFGYGSLNNSYAIGNPLQKWMNDDIQSGSPAFANFGANAFIGVDPENTFLFGVGASFNLPPSHSIWGSSLYFGGRNELVLDPYTFSLDLPLRYALKDTGLSFTLAPSLLMTFLSGKYTTNGNINIDGKLTTGTFYTNMGSMGMGFGMSIGAEYYLGPFGFGAKCGFRMLESDLNFDSTVGPWSPTDSQGNSIKLDLGGSYMTIGIMLKLGN